MNKIKFALLVLVLFCTVSVYSQEEFFGNNTGLSASYSRNFNFGGIESNNQINDGQLSLHFKNGFIFAGDYSKMSNSHFYGASIGYLVNNNNNDKLKGLFSLFYGELNDEFFKSTKYKVTSISFGLLKVLFSNSNFPSSLGATVSSSFFLFGTNNYQFQPTATFGYSQSFFANYPVYPVIGISKSLVLFDRESNNGDFNLHIGLNVRLSKP